MNEQTPGEAFADFMRGEATAPDTEASVADDLPRAPRADASQGSSHMDRSQPVDSWHQLGRWLTSGPRGDDQGNWTRIN